MTTTTNPPAATAMVRAIATILRAPTAYHYHLDHPLRQHVCLRRRCSPPSITVPAEAEAEAADTAGLRMPGRPELRCLHTRPCLRDRRRLLYRPARQQPKLQCALALSRQALSQRPSSIRRKSLRA